MSRSNPTFDVRDGPVLGRHASEFLVHLQVGTTNAELCHRLKDPGLHARQPADVDEGAIPNQEITVQSNFAIEVVVNVPLRATIRKELPTDHGVIMEVRVTIGGLSEEAVVKKVAGIRRPHHQVNLTLARAVGALQQVLDHPPERRNAGPGGEKKVIVTIRHLGKNETLARRTGDLNLSSRLQIAHVVGTDSEMKPPLLIVGS